MELEFASELVDGKDINQNELFFISDIEDFSQKTKKMLLDKIKQGNYKAIVFAGDILSGFSTEDSSYKIFEKSSTAFEMFYDFKKIIKKYSRQKMDKSDVARYYVGHEVSERLSKNYAEELKAFKSFVQECHKNRIPVVLFSGNHDSLFSWANLSDERFIPVLDEIHSLKGLKIPHDFEAIKLKKDLYLMGIHTDEDIISEYEFPRIKGILEGLNETIENPEQIIFVSHIPGIKKFNNLGSQDISNLKKKFKFKYHYHGHCKDYYGEYEEEGIPTRSVHIKEDEKLEAESKKGEIKLRKQ